MLIQPINSRFRKNQLQIREGGKLENIANEENKLWEIFLMTMKKIIGNIGEEHELFITT